MCRHFGITPAAKIPQQLWKHMAIYQTQCSAPSVQTICNCNTDNPTDISSYACVQTHKTHGAGQFTCSLQWSYSPSPPPLSQACIDDNVDMVTFLVEHGAGINQPDNEGWIPLHAAASCGYLDIAEWVLRGLFAMELSQFLRSSISFIKFHFLQTHPRILFCI